MPATVSYRHFRSYVVIVPVGAIVLLILLAPLVLAMAFALQRIMDRRRLVLNRNPNDVSAGRFVTCIPVELVVEHEAAMHIAETAIAKSGGTEIERWDDSTVTGWTKMPFPGFGWAPQQLSVVVTTTEAQGACRLLCYSRPRLAMARWDLGRRKQVAEQLADAVQREGWFLAHPDST